MGNQISRRQFLKGSIAGAGMLGLAGLAGAFPDTGRRPNFVVILVDDLGYQDVGCFGSPLISTPNEDRMAREGIKLTSYYAQTVCTPSRAALLTGCYPTRVGLPNVLNPKDKIGISAKEKTIADLLKTRGYATACIGKWHLGWEKPFLPTRHGFDYFYGLPYSNDMGREIPVPLMQQETIIEQPVNQDTLTQRYTQEAVKFIEQHKDEPFFLYLAHTMVHVPLHVSPAFRGKSKRGLYGDAAEEVDWSTGQVLDTLKKLGLDDNTLVVFTSDNGPWLKQGENGGCALPLRDGKGTTYDGGVRVPCIVRWPGKIPPGQVSNQIVTEMDLLPTFAKLSGTKPPADRIIDGRDAWPLLSGKPGAVSAHDVLFFYKSNRLQALRSGKWKLDFPEKDKPVELFDMDADISEKNNVADRYPSIVARLSKLAENCRQDLGDAITGVQGKNRRPPDRVETDAPGPISPSLNKK